MSQLAQTRTSSLGAARPLPPSADIGPGGQSVGQAAQFCLEGRFPPLRGGLQRLLGLGRYQTPARSTRLRAAGSTAPRSPPSR
jgi:hypothetical protein